MKNLYRMLLLTAVISGNMLIGMHVEDTRQEVAGQVEGYQPLSRNLKVMPMDMQNQIILPSQRPSLTPTRVTEKTGIALTANDVNLAKLTNPKLTAIANLFEPLNETYSFNKAQNTLSKLIDNELQQTSNVDSPENITMDYLKGQPTSNLITLLTTAPSKSNDATGEYIGRDRVWSALKSSLSDSIGLTGLRAKLQSSTQGKVIEQQAQQLENQATNQIQQEAKNDTLTPSRASQILSSLSNGWSNLVARFTGKKTESTEPYKEVILLDTSRDSFSSTDSFNPEDASIPSQKSWAQSARSAIYNAPGNLVEAMGGNKNFMSDRTFRKPNNTATDVYNTFVDNQNKEVQLTQV